MKLCLVHLVASTVLSTVLAGRVHACSCVDGHTVKDHFSQATYVFVGKVVAIHEIKSRAAMPGWEGVAAEFQLVESIKRPRPFPPRLESGRGHGDCGVHMQVGDSYIFFVNAQREINICTGTRAYVKGDRKDEECLREVKSLAPIKKTP